MMLTTPGTVSPSVRASTVSCIARVAAAARTHNREATYTPKARRNGRRIARHEVTSTLVSSTVVIVPGAVAARSVLSNVMKSWSPSRHRENALPGPERGWPMTPQHEQS